jgi:hypothetical protein
VGVRLRPIQPPRKYPIPDKTHARNALARVARNGTTAEQKKARAAAKKRFPSISLDLSCDTQVGSRMPSKIIFCLPFWCRVGL